MSYTINEVPAVLGRTELVVDGKVVATAAPGTAGSVVARPPGQWTVNFDGVVPLYVKEPTVHALFKFIGELVSPTKPSTIDGPDELDQAALGSFWTSAYNKGTYRRGQYGWDYRLPDSATWHDIQKSVAMRAYPLTITKAV